MELDARWHRAALAGQALRLAARAVGSANLLSLQADIEKLFEMWAQAMEAEDAEKQSGTLRQARAPDPIQAPPQVMPPAGRPDAGANRELPSQRMVPATKIIADQLNMLEAGVYALRQQLDLRAALQ